MTDHPITPPLERKPSFAELLMPIPKAQVESQPFGNPSITPPFDLIVKWASQAVEAANCSADVTVSVATQAAKWGADQELEACCEWLVSEGWFKYEHEAVEDLRAARRPKPPTLKQRAQRNLANMIKNGHLSPDLIELFTAAVEMAPDE